VWALWKLFCSFQVPCGRVLRVHRDGSVHTVFHCPKFSDHVEARQDDDRATCLTEQEVLVLREKHHLIILKSFTDASV